MKKIEAFKKELEELLSDFTTEQLKNEDYVSEAFMRSFYALSDQTGVAAVTTRKDYMVMVLKRDGHLLYMLQLLENLVSKHSHKKPHFRDLTPLIQKAYEKICKYVGEKLPKKISKEGEPWIGGQVRVSFILGKTAIHMGLAFAMNKPKIFEPVGTFVLFSWDDAKNIKGLIGGFVHIAEFIKDLKDLLWIPA